MVGHDSKMPGNRYIEGELTTPVKANYLRVLYTADYDARFVGFTELVINDGEFVKPINDPTVEGETVVEKPEATFIIIL